MKTNCFFALFLVVLLSTVVQAQEEVDSAYDKAVADFMGAKTPEEKLVALRAFVTSFPDHPRVAGGMLRQAVGILRDEMNDLEGAIALVSSVRRETKTASSSHATGTLLAGLLGEAGKKAELETLVEEFEGEGALDYYFLETAIDAAVKVESWELALRLSYPALPSATPEAVLEEIPEAKNFPKERPEAIAKWRRGNVLSMRAWALVNLDRMDEAMAEFDAAKESTVFDFAGVSQNRYAPFLALAYLRRGDPDAAIEIVAPNALFQGKPESRQVLRKALEARHGSDVDFDKLESDLRDRLAVNIADFALKDYQGREHRFSDIRGKVTVLVFWFPT